MIPRLALVGLGWHARRIHYPWLERAVGEGRARLVAVIERPEALAGVEAWLAGRALRPERLLAVGGEVGELFDALRAGPGLDAVLVASEAGAHLPAVLQAAERGIDVLVDKPLCAPVGEVDVGGALLRAHGAALAAQGRGGGRVVVLAQRRAHPAYLGMRAELASVCARFGLPVTALRVSHSDGMWPMPWEWDRDHHPYRHGAGKLLHSGYHFVDLVPWLLGEGASGRLAVAVMEAGPADIDARSAGARADLPGPPGGPPVRLAHPGEVDLCATARLSREGRVQSLVQLELLQGGVSARATRAPALDPYKGSGRVRHEEIAVHAGPLLHMVLSSHQGGGPLAASGPGHEDHLELRLFRHPLLEGPAVEVRELSAPRHNEAARERMLEDFLAGGECGSPLADHGRTTELLAALFRARDAGRRGEAPIAEVEWGGR